MPFYPMQETFYHQKRKGVRIKSFSGENIQVTLILLEPGFVSSHRHPEEQIGYILSGEVELTIGEETRECGSGDGYHIPSETPHSFRVLSKQAVQLLEAFSPPKEENKV